jgi:exonuclease III
MRFVTWNVRSLCISGSLTAAARELVRYELDLVDIQGVRWEKRGTVKAGDYIFFYGKVRENHQFGTGIFVHHRIISVVTRVYFVSDGLSYIVLRGGSCNIINVHAPSEKESDDSKDGFCEELKKVIDHFPKYHTKIP